MKSETPRSLWRCSICGARELDACYEGRARHPVFVALAETIRACSIPKEPFADLLIAFRQDQTVTRYRTMQDVLDYCRYSANPVGRLVLYACGYADEERFRLSDATCSALQLANFWQDVRVDFRQGPRLSSAGRHAAIRRHRRDHCRRNRDAGVPRAARL